jgi:FHA domain
MAWTGTLDVAIATSKNRWVFVAGAHRGRLVRTLNAAYGDGLISEQTLARRLDEVLGSRLIDDRRLVGDLRLRPRRGSAGERLARGLASIRERVHGLLAEPRPATLLALDWSGEPRELIVGRASCSDVVVSDPTVSRRHARLIFRDGKWVLQDLGSRNGSAVNGRFAGRCELRPGDRLRLGDAELLVD